jgi:uncharacterized repeat protein (TIGR01451 family)
VGATTNFTNPTTSLTIHSGGGSSVVNVNALGSSSIGGLTIDGPVGTGSITISPALTLGTSANNGALSLTAPTINLNGSSIGTAGTATFNGTVVLGTDVSIHSDLLGSNGDITFGGTVNVTSAGGQGLTLTAGGNVNLAAVGSNAPVSSLTIQKAGTATLSGAIQSTGNVSISADDMAINAAVTTSNSTVTLAPFTAARVISLGANTAGQLGLSDAELDRITSAVLHIGSPANTGGISFTGMVDAENHYATLSLETGGAITHNHFGVDPIVPNLAMRAGTTIGIGDSFGNICTQVSNLAFSAGGGVGIAQVNIPLTFTAVDGLNSSSSGGTTGLFNAGGGAINFNQNVTSAGNLIVQTFGAGDNITINAPFTVQSASGSVNMTAGTNFTLSSGSVVSAGSSATLTGGADNAGSAITISGPITGTSASVLCGSGADTITVTTTGSTPLKVNGMGGGDSIIIDFGSLNAAVNVAETGTGSNQVTLYGSDAGDTFTVNHTRTMDGGQMVSYSGIQAVTVNGGTGSDTFNVTPSNTIPFTINGGQPTPPANPGDTLNVNLAGTTSPNLSDNFDPASGYSGQWTFGNRKAVSFTGIETLLPDAELSVINSAPSNVAAGTNLTYSITFINSGPSVAFNALLSDTLPANTTFVSFTAPTGWMTSTPGMGNTGTVTATDSSAAVGIYHFTLVVHVSGALSYGAALSNTATVSSSSIERNTSKNSATATTTVVTPLISSLQVSQNVPKGSLATLTGAFTNPVPADALVLTVNWGDSTILTYTLPAGTTSFSETHAYTKVGGYTITASLHDNTTLSTSPSQMVTTNVVNVPPSVYMVSAPLTGTTGQSLTFVGGVNDPDPLSTLMVSWSITPHGNSSPVYSVPYHPATDAGALALTYAFATQGLYTLTFSVKDQYGVVRSITFDVFISG